MTEYLIFIRTRRFYVLEIKISGISQGSHRGATYGTRFLEKLSSQRFCIDFVAIVQIKSESTQLFISVKNRKRYLKEKIDLYRAERENDFERKSFIGNWEMETNERDFLERSI